MSWITDVIVLPAWDDRLARLDEVNAKLAEIDTARQQQFGSYDGSGDEMDWAGGSKFFVSTMWAAAFNHLTIDKIGEALASAKWKKPEAIVVAWLDEGEDEWAVGTVASLSDRSNP